MTRKRLRKNVNKNFGAKKHALAMCKHRPTGFVAGSVVQSLEQNLTNDSNLCLPTNLGVESNKLFSITESQETMNRAIPVQTQLRFRYINAIRGRELNDHNEVWQPAMVDCEYMDNETNPMGLNGLCNIGNTCFLNASVQALVNCPPFVEFFRSVKSIVPFSTKIDEIPIVAQAFHRLVNDIWSEKRDRCVNPHNFLVRFREHCPQFRPCVQQDAQEFIRCLLDLLHRELRQPVFEWEYRDINLMSSETTMSSNLKFSDGTRRDNSSHPNSITRSDSHTSDEDDYYETADSGWSSDAEAPTTSVKSATSSEMQVSHDQSGVDSSRCTTIQSTKSNKNQRQQQRRLVGYRSLVTDVFDGQLQSVVKCLTCQHLSKTYETFQDLSLSIPTLEQLARMDSNVSSSEKEDDLKIDSENNEEKSAVESIWRLPWWMGFGWLKSFYRYLFGESVSLNDAIASFFSPDDLRGDNMYSCEHCSKLRNGVKICKIVKAPEILCIHLKKFRHDLSYPTKIKTRINFPLHDLDLSPFIAPSKKSECVHYYYDLCAFISHTGSSAESGHYVAYCKNDYSGDWYEYDDSNVSSLDTAEILTKEAYVLFYQRQTCEDMEKTKSLVKDLIEREPEKTVKLKPSLRFYVSREWLHRLSTFADPGMITNHDFLCEHAQILPRRATNLTDYYATVGSQLWDSLFKKFDGGPQCTELHYCLMCQNEHQCIQRKRDSEFKAFVELDKRLGELSELRPSATFSHYMPMNAIEKLWFDKWKAFITGDELEPPGPIKNANLLSRCPNEMAYRLCSSQYIRIPHEIWVFLHSAYGGGPEVLCVNCAQPSRQALNDLIKEIDQKIAQNLHLNDSYQEVGIS